MGDLQNAVAFRTNIGRHLAQLSRLMGAIVQEESLLSPRETETLREKSKAMAYDPSWRATLEFSEKSGPRFRRLIAAIGELNPGGVYIWTPLSNVCGVHRPVSLEAIQWGFDFDLIPEGILVLLTADLSDKMLLDFSESQTTRKELELEVSGQHWGRSIF